MELKKAFKHTSLGEIPIDWEEIEIGQIIDLLTGFPFPSSKYSESGIRLLRGSNVKRGKTDWSDDITQFWPEATSELLKYKLKEGDIVIAMDGSLVGRSFARISKSDIPSLLLQRVARIRTEKLDAGYLKELVCSDYFTKHCDNVKTSSAIPHISPKDIRDFKIPVPPTKAEQTAIATALSDMDNLIAGLEKLIEKKKAIKQGAMQELLRPKEGWVVKKFGEIFTFYTTANYSKAEMTDAGDIGCMHYGLVHSISTANYSLSGGVRYYLNETKTNYEFIKDGDVIMVDASEDLEGVNKSVEVFGIGDQKFISGLHTYLLRDQNSVLANGFRGPLLNSKLIKDQFLSLAVGMKVFGVSKVQLKEVLVPVPPKDEQAIIANTLFEMDAEIEAIGGSLDKNRRLKQGMMQELLTGKIRMV